MKWTGFFKRKREEVLQTGRPYAWQLKIIERQKAYAGWLQMRSEALSPLLKRVLLGLFLLASTCLSTCLLSRPLGQTGKLVKINRITLPASPGQPAQQGFLTEQEYGRLKSFRSHMDSLARSPTGSGTYQRFDKGHPGLLDSIRTLEQLYDLQIKNKKNGNETQR